MAEIQLSNGGVYNFITQGGSTAHIASIGGTDYPFKTYFMQGILTSGSSIIKNLTANGLVLTQGLHRYANPIINAYGPLPIDTDSIATSSINTGNKLLASGSMYSFYGNTNHLIDLATPNDAKNGTIVRFMKLTNTTNIITITANSLTINSSSSLSCSDPYATIELISTDDPVTTGGKWIILSKNGAWS